MKSLAVSHFVDLNQLILLLTCIYNHSPSSSRYRNLVSFRKVFQQSIKENHFRTNHILVFTDLNMPRTNGALLNFHNGYENDITEMVEFDNLALLVVEPTCFKNNLDKFSPWMDSVVTDAQNLLSCFQLTRTCFHVSSCPITRDRNRFGPI